MLPCKTSEDVLKIAKEQQVNYVPYRKRLLACAELCGDAVIELNCLITEYIGGDFSFI
jgi:hypothetical protein